MQGSRRGLTRVEQMGRITFLTLLAMLLLMQPRIWLACWAASAHCQVMLSFSSTMDLRLSNMIVCHRESLENQGSQARRVPEAYR